MRSGVLWSQVEKGEIKMDRERVNDIARQLLVSRALRARTIAIIVQDVAEFVKGGTITDEESVEFTDAIYEEFKSKAFEEYKKITGDRNK